MQQAAPSSQPSYHGPPINAYSHPNNQYSGNGNSHYGSHQPQSPYATGNMNGGFNGNGPYASSGGGGGSGQYMHRGQIYAGKLLK